MIEIGQQMIKAIYEIFGWISIQVEKKEADISFIVKFFCNLAPYSNPVHFNHVNSMWFLQKLKNEWMDEWYVLAMKNAKYIWMSKQEALQIEFNECVCVVLCCVVWCVHVHIV